MQGETTRIENNYKWTAKENNQTASKPDYMNEYNPTASIWAMRRNRCRSTICTKGLTYQWLCLTYMPHTINKILSDANWKPMDVLEHFQPPKNIWETHLIPRCETNYFIKPEAHKQVSQWCMLPHNDWGLVESCKDQQLCNHSSCSYNAKRCVCVCLLGGGGGWGRKGGGLDRCNSFRPNQIRLWASGCEYRCVSVTFPFHHYIQIFEQKTALCKETGLDRKSWSSVCYIKPIFI